jgi:hypothetical protein
MSRMLNIEQAGERLGISRSEVVHLIEERVFGVSYVVPGEALIPTADVERFDRKREDKKRGEALSAARALVHLDREIEDDERWLTRGHVLLLANAHGRPAPCDVRRLRRERGRKWLTAVQGDLAARNCPDRRNVLART